jgi:hypothetical protein
VRLDEVPAARPDDELGGPFAEAVRLALGRLEGERAADGVDERRLSGDDVGPGRRERVLEVGHEHARPRVERVDHHLGLGGTGDLDAPVIEGRPVPGRRSSRLADSRVPGRKSSVTPFSSSAWRSCVAA